MRGEYVHWVCRYNYSALRTGTSFSQLLIIVQIESRITFLRAAVVVVVVSSDGAVNRNHWVSLDGEDRHVELQCSCRENFQGIPFPVCVATRFITFLPSQRKQPGCCVLFYNPTTADSYRTLSPARSSNQYTLLIHAHHHLPFPPLRPSSSSSPPAAPPSPSPRVYERTLDSAYKPHDVSPTPRPSPPSSPPPETG